ncbi:hypothetical protein ABZZ20_24195 [Streptomyces sp. NPDC006430]|uniref:hypothetical protein n=1 Tax=Streptomyces sp. NPDC006430 TaxID=3154299 RepID=UPI0033B0C62D
MTKTHTVIGVLAGTASALVIVGVAWWQHWYKFFIGWAAVKIGAKVAVVAVAGCVAFAARRRKRQQRRAAQQEGSAPLPEQDA